VRISIVTLFKEFFDSPLEVSLVGRAIADGHIDIDFHDPRDHAEGTHRQVDDSPFGGGAGMVMTIISRWCVAVMRASTSVLRTTSSTKRSHWGISYSWVAKSQRLA